MQFTNQYRTVRITKREGSCLSFFFFFFFSRKRREENKQAAFVGLLVFVDDLIEKTVFWGQG